MGGARLNFYDFLTEDHVLINFRFRACRPPRTPIFAQISSVRIAVNTRLLLKDKLEGIGWFTYENLIRISANHPEHTFLFLFDRPFDPSFVFADNVEPIVIGPQARHPILFRWWFNISVTKALKKHKADVFFSPDGFLSLSTTIPQIAAIHDLNFEHYPGDLQRRNARYYKRYFPKFARIATRIVTVSEFSKQDICSQYGIDHSRIDVVHNGVNENFHSLEEDSKLVVRNKYAEGNPYFIFVGSLHPRKNITRLLLAFDEMKSSTGCPHKIILVGNRYWWNSAMEQSFQSLVHKEDVIFQGGVSGELLNNLIASSEAMTFVPYFEGFGIPILEAFKCETVLITSNVTSMPQVAGDAALLVDPFSVESIAEAMRKVASGEVDRENLISRGRQRVTHFSWNKTAELLWKSIEKVLSTI